MKIQTLDDLLLHELRDLYSAETQITKALPKMAKKASSGELRSLLQEHLEQTRHQIERLDQVFDQLGAKSRGVKCKGMECILEEGKELMDQDVEDDVLNAGLIASAQKVEHYEIAGYGCCRTWAEHLGHDEVVDLLQETLDEEKQADQKLTDLAERLINEQAAHEEGDGGEDDGEEADDQQMVGAGTGNGARRVAGGRGGMPARGPAGGRVGGRTTPAGRR